MKRRARVVRRVGFGFLFGVMAFGGQSTRPVASPPRLPAEARTVSTSARTQSDLAKNKTRVLDAYGKVPLSFEPNRGQTDSRVKFLSRGNGYTVFLTSNEAVLTLQQPSAPQKASELRMRLVGGKAAPAVAGLDELSSKSHYFIGNDAASWHSNIPTYGKVRYEEAYPGIDLVFYGHRRQLEYDFVVAPGADPRAITLGFEGAAQMRIDSRGDLVLPSGAGEARFHKPVVYQTNGVDRTHVDGRYVRKGRNQVRFEIAAYDRTRPLVIDPTLSYSTYLGGTSIDTALGIAVDDAGDAYVTGTAGSRDFPTASPLQPTPGSPLDVFVAKFDPTGGTLLYSTFFGGQGEDYGRGIAVDGSGRAFVTGSTRSGDFPTMNPYQAANAADGTDSAFVAAFAGDGAALIYSTYLGGPGGTSGYGIAVDTAGNAYVTGVTGPNFPTVHPAQAYGGGEVDAFVASFNPTGAARYATYLGGSLRDTATGIAVDGAGHAYVTGYTTSTDFPTVNPLQPVSAGEYDAFVVAFDPTGSTLLYSTYLGGSRSDYGRAIAVDAAGHAFVTGNTTSNDFPTMNPLQPTNASPFLNDAFVAALDPAGVTLLYATYLGGGGNDYGYGIAVDGSGNAYVIGQTSSATFPTVDPVQAANGGRNDVFAASLDPAGATLRFATYLGGSWDDYGYAIAVDRAGNAYLTGVAQSRDFPTVNPFQATNRAGSNDWWNAFVAKLTFEAVPPPAADAPTFTPPGGTYDQPLSAALSTTTGGAMIYYTTDGSTPTPSSTAYTGPIAIRRTTTIQAMATASGMLDSAVSSATFTLQAAAPTFDPPGGSYLIPQRVSISDASPGTTIYYTTNGSTPTISSAPYTRPILVLRTTTIRAIAVAAGWSQSPVVGATYRMRLP